MHAWRKLTQHRPGDRSALLGLPAYSIARVRSDCENFRCDRTHIEVAGPKQPQKRQIGVLPMHERAAPISAMRPHRYSAPSAASVEFGSLALPTWSNARCAPPPASLRSAAISFQHYPLELPEKRVYRRPPSACRVSPYYVPRLQREPLPWQALRALRRCHTRRLLRLRSQSRRAIVIHETTG